MIVTGCLEILLEVISVLPRLELEVMLSSDDELLIGVSDLLVIVSHVVASGDHDSLESPL
jgi:hypothetical protein